MDERGYIVELSREELDDVILELDDGKLRRRLQVMRDFADHTAGMRQGAAILSGLRTFGDTGATMLEFARRFGLAPNSVNTYTHKLVIAGDIMRTGNKRNGSCIFFAKGGGDSNGD